MKLFVVLAGLLLFGTPDPTLLVLDKNLKKPIQPVTGFTPDQYMQNCFPVYAADVEAITRAADTVVKRMDNAACLMVDTITAAHTRFIIISDCVVMQRVSVMLITEVEETNTTFSFTLVAKEENRRKAQQKLLNFATYLAQ